MMTEVTVEVIAPPAPYDPNTVQPSVTVPAEEPPVVETPAPVETPAQTEPPVDPGPVSPGDIEFTSGWDELWATLTTGYPGLSATMTTIGILMVSYAIVKWAWAARNGANHRTAAKPVWGFLLIGSIMAAPTLLIPMILSVLEIFVSIGVSLAQKGIG